MYQGKKIALLMDVDNVKISGEAFNELYQKLHEIGDVVYCKFYGYNDRKHIYLSEAIASFGYETAPFMRFKKRFSQLDVRMVVDAIKLNYTKPEIDTYCIVAGDGDLIPCLVELKSCGKTIIDINSPYQELNYHMFDAHITLESIDKEAEVYVSKTKKTKTSDAVAKTTRKPAPVPVKINDEEEDEQPAPARAAAKPARKPAPAETYDYDEEDDYIEETPSYNETLGDIVRDISNRYTELDFSNNSEMPKKRKLIADIEDLISTETNKGEGLSSKDADIRQIFVELQNIVDDMKNAIADNE